MIPAVPGRLFTRPQNPSEGSRMAAAPIAVGRPELPGNDFILTRNESMASAKIAQFFAGSTGPERPVKTGCGEAENTCTCRSATRLPTAFRFHRRTTCVAPASPVGARIAAASEPVGSTRLGRHWSIGRTKSVHPHGSRRKAVGTLNDSWLLGLRLGWRPPSSGASGHS